MASVETATRDPDYVPSLMGVSLGAPHVSTNVYVDETTHRLLVSGVVTSGLNLGTYDYVANAPDATHDVYTFFSGGSGGTLLATVTITYTDSTKAVISTVAKT